jgi:NADPH:quinone reductase-like Zn-dependent oxidoreductase
VKAIVYTHYGGPDVLHLAEVAKPVVKDNEILVRVRATTVTAGDIRMRKADPPLARLYNGLLRPRRVTVLGFDLAGDVEAVGNRVTLFRPGDAVFASCGFGFGAYAEYRCLPQDGMLALKPANMSYAEAATVPYGAMAALYYLRDEAQIHSGHKVLIIGASGSVGTFAVQLARCFGAAVTGVCSARNTGLVTSLGASAVIDYTKEDFTTRGDRFDLIFDAVGKSSAARCKPALAQNGRYLTITKGGPSPRQCALGLVFLKEMIEAGTIRSVIDRSFPLAQAAEAHRYAESGLKQGHVVITVADTVADTAADSPQTCNPNDEERT